MKEVLITAEQIFEKEIDAGNYSFKNNRDILVQVRFSDSLDLYFSLIKKLKGNVMARISVGMDYILIEPGVDGEAKIMEETKLELLGFYLSGTGNI